MPFYKRQIKKLLGFLIRNNQEHFAKLATTYFFAGMSKKISSFNPFRAAFLCGCEVMSVLKAFSSCALKAPFFPHSRARYFFLLGTLTLLESNNSVITPEIPWREISSRKSTQKLWSNFKSAIIVNLMILKINNEKTFYNITAFGVYCKQKMTKKQKYSLTSAFFCAI